MLSHLDKPKLLTFCKAFLKGGVIIFFTEEFPFMYCFEDFMDYFANRHYCMKTPEKKTREAIAVYFDGVEPKRVDLITRKVKSLGYSIDESTSGCMDYFFRAIRFPFRNARRTAFHELGHAVDFIRVDKIVQKIGSGTKIGWKEHYFSSDVVLSTGKTLHQTVKLEANAKANELYMMLRKAFDREVLSAFPEDIAKEYALGRECHSAIRHLRSQYHHCKDRERADAKALWNELRRWETIRGKHDYFKAVNKIVDKSSEYKAFNDKYDILSDMLSGCTDTHGIFTGHSRSYMNAKGGFGCEFFADMFSAETTKCREAIELAERYLPQSVAAYRELYAIVQVRTSQDL